MKDSATAAPTADLFAQALRDDSNLELDWLWLLTRVTRECEQRIALERVLYINPGNARAHRALARLSAPLAAEEGARSVPVAENRPCEG